MFNVEQVRRSCALVLRVRHLQLSNAHIWTDQRYILSGFYGAGNGVSALIYNYNPSASPSDSGESTDDSVFGNIMVQ